MLDAVRRARLKQLRGPRSQAPTAPKAAHACLQCPDVYKDCDALIMHRLRHVNGKHWPCPVRRFSSDYIFIHIYMYENLSIFLYHKKHANIWIHSVSYQNELMIVVSK